MVSLIIRLAVGPVIGLSPACSPEPEELPTTAMTSSSSFESGTLMAALQPVAEIIKAGDIGTATCLTVDTAIRRLILDFEGAGTMVRE
ncbi:hypothetical protein F4809DRAFT_639737 [Biscogniauxia mediterranea]|nr:hypothetical protein F4809DRAFT_639737 [Biscogniauxia mediterranea]